MGQFTWNTVVSPSGDGNLWGHLLILVAYAAGFAAIETDWVAIYNQMPHG